MASKCKGILDVRSAFVSRQGGLGRRGSGSPEQTSPEQTSPRVPEMFGEDGGLVVSTHHLADRV